MRAVMTEILRGDGSRARAIRSTAMVVIGFGGTNVLRLVSNLILTRLLFPEAFGLMALVQVFLIGLQMFSDVGINTSIVQNRRGDDPDFLNTAWTLQILRGAVLWLLSCIIAWPAAVIYDEPQLLQLLPVAGLTALVTGFATTKIATADRNLQMGMQVVTSLGAQVAGMLITVALALLWHNVWSLVVGGLLGALLSNWLQGRVLPGPRNRLHWDRDAVHQIVHFGKYIFLSSIAAFLYSQGDRAILGGYVSMADLGIYTVSYMMAMLPQQLLATAGGRVLFPLYSKFPDLSIPGNRRNVRRARRLLLLGAMTLTCLMTLGGVALINFLYDARYAMAGPMLVLMGLPSTAQMAYSLSDSALLARGNSWALFVLNTSRAVIQTSLLFLGVVFYGIPGAIAAQVLGVVFMYPILAVMLHRYHAWDPVADAVTALAGSIAVALACLLWRDEIAAFWAWSL